METSIGETGMPNKGNKFSRWIARLFRTSKYRRLSSKASTIKRVKAVKLGDRKRWGFRRHKIKWISPLSLPSKLRDAYVGSMLTASSKLCSREPLTGGFPLFIVRQNAFGKLQAREYERKAMAELQTSLAQTQLRVACL